ncbi:energy transducer TonB [Sphingomonas sp. LT1P40]|uniref:energy transducer TonB n=1 Tax=Alteristakelama amylovorans TaxID=3096166 RepID=UPI002FC9042A
MTVNRYRPTASRPAGVAASLIVIGFVGSGLMLVGPKIAPDMFDPPIVIETIAIPEPPPPEPQPKPVEKRIEQRTPPIHQPDPIVITPPTPRGPATTSEPVRLYPDPPAGPTGLTGGGVTLDPPRAPVLTGAAYDQRYADALQPPYPASEIRAQTEGSVSLRVLIGVDGRVKAIEILRSPSDGLSKATRRHALAKWRFKPATRDGIPVESWKSMTLRFQIIE